MAAKIYTLQETIDKLDLSSAWKKGRFLCVSCRKDMNGEYFKTDVGKVCVHCVSSELKKKARTMNLAQWTTTQFIEALEPPGKLRSRLTVLWRYKEVEQLVSQRKASDVGHLEKLLVQNLGFAQKHPLAHFVQQAAIEACTRKGQSLLPLLLLNTGESAPWQLHTNVVAAIGNINPHHPDALKFIRKAALDTRAEVRAKAQSVLVKNALVPGGKIPNQTEAPPPQPLKQEQLLKQFPPRLGKFVSIGTDADKTAEKPAESSDLFRMETSLEIRMQDVVNELYNADVLKRYYKYCVRQNIFHGDDFRIDGKTTKIDKLKKAQLTCPLAKVFSSKDRFLPFLAKFPDEFQEILHTLVWEGGEREAASLEKRYNVNIINTKKKYSYGNPVQDIDEQFLLFQFRTQYAWGGYSGYSHRYFLALSEKLRAALKRYLPVPPESELLPVKERQKTDIVYENRDQIVTQLKLYYSYIVQGNLKYSKSTGKLLKSSLTQMKKYCNIQEFFHSKDKNLHYLKTNLIIDFFEGVHCDVSADPVEMLKQRFQDFFQDTHDHSKKLYEFLYHLKGRYYEFNYRQREKRVRKNLKGLLKALPTGEWITIGNLEKYCLYQNIDIQVTTKTYENELYFNRKIQGRSYHRDERVYARGAYYKDATLVPFLKTMMFLFATFGLVDIAYDEPENEVLQERNLNYLSPFDGLRYVRLTELGAYVVGLKRRYTADIQEASASIELDPKRLILAVDGNDPLKVLTLEKIADKISANTYKVSYNSFLKECERKVDVQQKIELFHKHIATNPPENWKEFLDDVQKKINPLSDRQKMAVFKLKQNKNLIALMARDDVLKKYILKAEEYHILIEDKHIPKVKKRLEEFGYFIDNI